MRPNSMPFLGFFYCNKRTRLYKTIVDALLRQVYKY